MTPVEKMARNLCESAGDVPDEIGVSYGRSVLMWHKWVPDAESALTALRDPDLRAVAHTADKLGMDPTKVAAVWMTMMDEMSK